MIRANQASKLPFRSIHQPHSAHTHAASVPFRSALRRARARSHLTAFPGRNPKRDASNVDGVEKFMRRRTLPACFSSSMARHWSRPLPEFAVSMIPTREPLLAPFFASPRSTPRPLCVLRRTSLGTALLRDNCSLERSVVGKQRSVLCERCEGM